MSRFQAGALVVYGNLGVHEVEGVGLRRFGDESAREYYTLRPYFSDSHDRSYIPTEKEAALRPVTPAQQAEADLARVKAEKLPIPAQQLLLGTLTIGATDTVTGHFLTPYLDGLPPPAPRHPAEDRQRPQRQGAELAEAPAWWTSPSPPPPRTSTNLLRLAPASTTHSVFVAGQRLSTAISTTIYSLQEIAAFPLILLERKASSRVFLEQEFLKRRRYPDPGDRAVLPRSFWWTLAGIGLGVAGVTEEFVRRDLEQGSIRVLKTDFEIPSRTVDMCTLREVSPTAAASRFIEMVQEGTKKG